MIRRVSPEGRARAQRERQRRQRATARLAGRMMLAALGIAVAAFVVDLAVYPIGPTGLVVAALVSLAAALAIAVLGRDRPVSLDQARLDSLPGETERWLEQQRPRLPQTSGAVLDMITLRLGEITPQLATIDPSEPAADAVRRLLARDLPAPVRGYQDVPPSLRARTDAGGRSADTQLLHGLALMESEIGRMSEQLARGALDELATQNRFLETKYEGAGGLDF